MSTLEIRPFDAELLDDAGRLLADRQRAQRIGEPGLDRAYEDPATARREIEALLGLDGVSGTAAMRGGTLAGYLVGVRRDDTTWGPNVWIEGAGHAVAEPGLVRDLYAAAAHRWVEEGRTNHHAIVPATDPALVEAWFSLDFGQQHIHAIRESPPSEFRPRVPGGMTIRRAVRDDIPALAELDLTLPRHQARSPVFSRLAVPTLEATVAELDEEFDDPRYATFVAEQGGRIVGTSIGSSIEVSSMHVGLTRPPSAGFLGFAAILPEARGIGAGRALGETVLAWSRDAGYGSVVTDWRSTNLQASRAWPALGFRPTFRRLHRSIA
jgi:ribosomal protein S18 acetylase RimI-like enzyme